MNIRINENKNILRVLSNLILTVIITYMIKRTWNPSNKAILIVVY